MRPVGYVTDPRYLEHLTGIGHPERPERIEAIRSRVANSGLLKDLTSLEARPAADDWIREIHDPAYVERVRLTCGRGSAIIDSSIHQWPFYPGTGAKSETGSGAGKGFTLNAPMPAGCHDDDYRRVFEEQLVPAITAFSPDAIIISAGFDAHRQ